VITPPAATITAVAPAAVLSDELQGKLLAIIGADNLGHALAWAVNVKWLQPDQPLELLPEKHAKAILAKPDAFNAALAKFIATPPK
jgi:hypothetical protein